MFHVPQFKDFGRFLFIGFGIGMDLPELTNRFEKLGILGSRLGVSAEVVLEAELTLKVISNSASLPSFVVTLLESLFVPFEKPVELEQGFD